MAYEYARRDQSSSAIAGGCLEDTQVWHAAVVDDEGRSIGWPWSITFVVVLHYVKCNILTLYLYLVGSLLFRLF